MSFFLTATRHVLSFVIIDGGHNFKWIRGETFLSHFLWPLRGIFWYIAMVITLRTTVRKAIHIPAGISAAHNLILCIGSGVMFAGCASAVLEVCPKTVCVLLAAQPPCQQLSQAPLTLRLGHPANSKNIISRCSLLGRVEQLDPFLESPSYSNSTCACH